MIGEILHTPVISLEDPVQDILIKNDKVMNHNNMDFSKKRFSFHADFNLWQQAQQTNDV